MKKIVILNAPARCGKDTIADALQEEISSLKRASFKWPLFDIFANTMGMQMEEFLTLYETDGWKDTPNEALNGQTPRALMIHISEGFIKPFFGNKYFGDWIGQFIKLHEQQAEEEMAWIIPDGGFDAEVEVLAEMFPNRVMVVQVSRLGFTDFTGDSRGWISPELSEKGVNFLIADTSGGNQDLIDTLKRTITAK